MSLDKYVGLLASMEAAEIDASSSTEVDNAPDIDFVDNDFDSPEQDSPANDTVTSHQDEVDQLAELDNSSEELADTTASLESLSIAAIELSSVLENTGKLSRSEFLAMSSLVASAGGSATSKLPSMEDYSVVGLEYANTQVSMEGVLDTITKLVHDSTAQLSRLVKNGIGLVSNLRPKVDKEIADARKALSELTDSDRNDGEKTVSGPFVMRLMIDGAAPEPAKLFSTAKYFDEMVKEVLSDSAQKQAMNQITSANKWVMKALAAHEAPDAGVVKTAVQLMLISGIAINLPVSAAGAAMHGGLMLAIRHARKDKIYRTSELDLSIAPKLINLYPTVAKVDMAMAEDHLIAKSTPPLFANGKVCISEYNPRAHITGKKHTVPRLWVEDIPFNKVPDSMQSLTSGQQREAIELAISMLESAKGYYAGYAARNKAVADLHISSANAWRKTLGRTIGVLSGGEVLRKQEVSVRNHICTAADGWYKRVYWNGIFQQQPHIARYARLTAKALVGLAVASDAKTAPSQEGFDLGNEFDM